MLNDCLVVESYAVEIPIESRGKRGRDQTIARILEQQYTSKNMKDASVTIILFSGDYDEWAMASRGDATMADDLRQR